MSTGQFNYKPAEGASEEELDVFYESVLAQGDGTLEGATSSAKAKAKRIAYSKRRVEITMPGNTGIIAGMHVNLDGFRAGVSGRYKVVTVRHSLSRSGFTTTITGEAA